MNKKAESGDISIGFNYDLSPNVNIGGFLGGGGAGTPSVGNQWRNDAFGNSQIFGRYYLSSDMAIRLGLGIHSNSTENINKDSADWGEMVTDSDGNNQSFGSDSASYSEVTTSSSQFNFSIAPGIEKHISTNSNIDPYFGAQIPIAILGSTSIDSTVERKGWNTANDNENTYSYESSREQPGGFGWGVQGLVGFNWFVDDKVSIGMEYKIGFMSTSQGGEVTGDWSAKGEDGSNSTEDDGSTWNHQTETSNGEFSTMSSGGINVSIFF